MIRLRLADVPVQSLAFDLAGRKLTVMHAGPAAAILERLLPLGYGAELRESHSIGGAGEHQPAGDPGVQARVLWLLLGINALMFAVEAVAGWLSGSAGLLSDAADMFADAAVYGVALYAVGRDANLKLTAAKTAGVLQLLLALTALGETGRRVILGTSPEEITMIAVSIVALIANIACLLLIARHREGEVHMRASYIFSANDVLANLGVIVAGVLVAWTASPLPDWIIGGVIGLVVLTGAVRILRL